MPNIKFNYLYRDAGNYKSFGAVILANPNNFTLQQAEELIRPKLIDGTWFYASQWQVPDLHIHNWDNDLDHTFHEFDSLEYTSEQPTLEASSLCHKHDNITALHDVA